MEDRCKKFAKIQDECQIYGEKPRHALNQTPSNEPDHQCDTVHDWAGHDVWAVALGWTGRQLSHDPAVFLHLHPLGASILAVLLPTLVSFILSYAGMRPCVFRMTALTKARGHTANSGNGWITAISLSGISRLPTWKRTSRPVPTRRSSCTAISL